MKPGVYSRGSASPSHPTPRRKHSLRNDSRMRTPAVRRVPPWQQFGATPRERAYRQALSPSRFASAGQNHAWLPLRCHHRPSEAKPAEFHRQVGMRIE